MDEEKNNNIKEMTNQIKQAQKVASKAASGNWIGAAKEALKSDAFKKKLKRKLIKYSIMALIPVIIAASFFGIANTVKDELVNLFVSIGTNTKGLISGLWQKINKATGNEYWVKLDEEGKTTYIMDVDTGEMLAYEDDNGNKMIAKRDKLAELVKEEYR